MSYRCSLHCQHHRRKDLRIAKDCDEEHKVSYRCSLPSPLQKRSQKKDCIGARTQRRTSLGFVPHMNPYNLDISLGSLLASIIFQKSDFRNQISKNRNNFPDFRHDGLRCPSLTDSRNFTEANFSTSGPLFFFLKISLLEMLMAFGNEHLKNEVLK